MDTPSSCACKDKLRVTAFAPNIFFTPCTHAPQPCSSGLDGSKASSCPEAPRVSCRAHRPQQGRATACRTCGKDERRHPSSGALKSVSSAIRVSTAGRQGMFQGAAGGEEGFMGSTQATDTSRVQARLLASKRQPTQQKPSTRKRTECCLRAHHGVM